ncbi:DDE-type integrase/transposase/recombinase [Halioglobus sp. Uisw_031]|uniref:DDE-type integrase/transposase/recombinase n=1 Tax=Halioglobus sp. Uisw_031 TaxID=3230977 RepID=UPI0039E8E021
MTVLSQAVDQSGEVVDMFLQAKRDGSATKRFLMSFVRPYSEEPRTSVTEPSRPSTFC